MWEARYNKLGFQVPGAASSNTDHDVMCIRLPSGNQPIDQCAYSACLNHEKALIHINNVVKTVIHYVRTQF